MKEPTSPFDLYGKLVMTYVNACLRANRAWIDNATAFTSAFVPRRVGESAPLVASTGVASSQAAAAEPSYTPIVTVSDEPLAATADQPPVLAAETALADPDILAAVREVVQLAPESAKSPAPKALPKRARRPGLRRKP